MQNRAAGSGGQLQKTRLQPVRCKARASRQSFSQYGLKHGMDMAVRGNRLVRGSQCRCKSSNIRCGHPGCGTRQFQNIRAARRARSSGMPKPQSIVLEQGDEGFVAGKFRQCRIDKQIQERRPIEADQRLAGGIVDLDCHSQQFVLDPARQFAIGRNQCRRLAAGSRARGGE